ncbi:MAG: BREX system P-loop protein BrxC [Defluviitaleaceae bacterium]|nr:BREX system P-loop protein BrxC [Defluviitaleaceae bacterium]
MKISTMFQKDIGRPIQGVIKIGANITEMAISELDEYVVTSELNRHMANFFAGYRKGTTQRTDKIGVWISGFFGSGKSHFLKILSFLLGYKEFGEKKAIDYFEGKISDSHIMADMQLAADTCADVILFNIDAEADSDSKSNKDPIVKVFMKVFNKMQGYCSSMPWIADLERQMDKDGVYQDFRNRFYELSGNSWEAARDDFYFEQDNIVQALADTTRMSADAALAWYNKSEENYSLDINSFSRRVREYIEAKQRERGKKQFVIFLCDEVGQYIGSSEALMLNLQNIVEGLGNECGGQAWVIATGQEDIDSITKVNRDAFSKIIGRFDTRLSLSSANVDEVIKKRLLAKSEGAADKLRLLYEEKIAVMKNLITFTKDTPEKRLYESPEDFADIYPFIPYQFPLLQAVFNGIRTHGASGKHLSEGERSLLNAFQEAAIQFANFDEGILIPFNAFYKTVETFLDNNVRRVIINAEESANRDSGVLYPDDVEVLKTLFMVKYIPERLPANLENITTVMLTNIDEDKIAFKKKVDASLRRLEAERLIIKNGDQFIFLTNEEQDINREIREIRISPADLIDKAGSEIFHVLFGLNKKHRYNDRHDFPFNTMIDDRPLGVQKEEIGIQVLTPYFAHGGIDESAIKLMSLGSTNVVVAMPQDAEFLNEMELSLQIDAFLRRSLSKKQTDSIELIKAAKSNERQNRIDRCRELIADSMRKAKIYVNGLNLDIREKAHEQRISDGFNALIENLYSKLSYITHPYISVDSLREMLSSEDNQDVLNGIPANEANYLALADMQDVIEHSHYRNINITMRSLIDQFSKMPYGWKDIDISGVVLSLFKNQKIRLELGGENILPGDISVAQYATKRDYIERLVVRWRDVISPVLINNAKDLAREIFGSGDMPSDEDGLMARIKQLATEELHGNHDSIKDLLGEYSKAPYPGKRILEYGKKLFEEIERIRDIKAFFDYLHSEKESLLDYSEDVSDIKKFFNNQSQRSIFDKALKMLQIYESNRTYVLDPEMIKLVEDIERITALASPYGEIHKLPELVEQFMTCFAQLLEEECEPIKAAIKTDRETTLADLGKRGIKDKYTDQVISEFDSLIERLSRVNNIYEAIAMETESNRMMLRFIQSFVNAEIETTESETVRRIKTITMKSLFTGTTQVSNEADVDRLVSEVGRKLKSLLEDDTIIQIV